MDINCILQWYQNKTINPLTKKRIKENGPIYNNYNRAYKKMFPDEFNFFDIEYGIDPISRKNIWEEKNNKKKFVYDDDFRNLIMYKKNSKIYCFEKLTILYLKKFDIQRHPITNDEIPNDIFKTVKEKNKQEKTPFDVKNSCMKVFQKMLDISVFIDYNDFLNLNTECLDKLYYETQDFYKNNIEMTKQIKDVFNFTTNDFNSKKFEEKQEIIINSYLKILFESDESLTYLINYIIIGGLGLVIPKISKEYPQFSFSFM